jgi:hypothetical protein
MPASLSDDEAAKRRTFFDSFLTMPPETAGEIIVRGVERRKARILVGSDAKYAALVERLMPVSYWKGSGGEAKNDCLDCGHRRRAHSPGPARPCSV